MYRPVKLPSAGAPALSQVKIDTFLGADLTNSPENVEPGRSPDCENMIREVPGKVRKRMGWHTVCSFGGRVNGFHRLTGHAPLVHAGTALYQWQGEAQPAPAALYTGANDARSRSWEMNGKLYIADGKALLCYDGAAVARVDADAYVPTVQIARAPNVGGEGYEELNLLQPRFREQFLGTAEDKVYQLTYAPLDDTPVEVELLQADGSWQAMAENTGFTVNRQAGAVTFTAAPGLSPVTGEDNVRITAARTVAGYADRVNHCAIGIQFGVSGATDRLFLSGNPAFAGHDWYSGLNDPTYWGDQAYAVLGQTNSAIVGYSVVNGRLAAHKDAADPDRNVIVREGTLVNGKPAFPVVNTLQGEGAVGPWTFGYLGAEPLFLTRLGVYAITAQDITGEKYSQMRSFYLNGRLLAEPGLADAFALVYRDMYWLCLNGRAYILDGLQATQTDRAAPYSTRQYAGFFCTNIPARVLWEQDGVLWFGAQDGRVCAFAAHAAAPASYSDDGAPIYACWRTPDLAGRTFYRNKTFSRFYVELASSIATGVRALARVAGLWEELFSDFVTARYFSWTNITWSKFTWSNDDTPRTLGERVRIKKADKAGFKVENGVLHEPFGLNSIGVEFAETGCYRA